VIALHRELSSAVPAVIYLIGALVVAQARRRLAGSVEARSRRPTSSSGFSGDELVQISVGRTPDDQPL
jgi:hypothetical protein